MPGLTPIVKEYLLWVKWYLTASHATDKLLMKGRVNQWGKPLCGLKKLPQPPQPSATTMLLSQHTSLWQAPSQWKKIMTRWKLKWWLTFFTIKLIRIGRDKFPVVIILYSHLFYYHGIIMFKLFKFRCRSYQVLNKNQFIETRIHYS